MEKEKKLSIYEINLLYLILAIAFISIGAFTQNMNLIFGILVTQILIIVLPNIWLVKSKGISFKKTFRFNNIGFKNVFLIILITMLTYPIAVFFQGVFITIVDLFIPLSPNPLPDLISQMPFIWSVFFISILPGICEEIMFRGTVLKAYEKLGVKKSIIISAVLFGLFHFTIINFVGPALLGIVFGIMVYRTNSIYSSMIAHALNNSIALVINYFVMKNMDLINDMSAGQVDLDPNIFETMLSFAFLGMIVFLLIKLVKMLLNQLTPLESEELEYIEYEFIEDIDKEEISKVAYIPLLITSIIFIVFNYIFILRI